MRAGVGQRDDPGLVLDERLDPLVDRVEEAADKPGVEVLLEPEIEQQSSGSRPVSRAISPIVRLASPAFSGFTGAATMTRSQLPWNIVPGIGLRRLCAEALAEARVAEHRLQLLAVIGLDRVEGRMAVERIGGGQREIERQRLAGELDIQLLAARLGRGAGIEHRRVPARELLVIEATGRCS